MATKKRRPANTFNFLRLHGINSGTTDDQPVQGFEPIDLTGIVAEIYPYFFGYTDLTDVSGLDITTGEQVNISGGGSLTVPWDADEGTTRLWVAIHESVAEKKYWSDPANNANQGTIGETDDLFLSSTTKTANGETYNFYITELATQARPLILEP